MKTGGAKTVYHNYSVPTILQVVTPISFLKKVILYPFRDEGVDDLQERCLHVVWLTSHSHRLSFKWCLWHQVHQLLLHAPMIGVLSGRLFDIAAYLLAFLLVIPYLDISLNSGVFITSAFRCFLMTFVRYRRHASLFSSVTNGGHCSP